MIVVDGEARVVERDRPALRVIRGEERVGSEAVVDRRQLPAQVVRVLHPVLAPNAPASGNWCAASPRTWTLPKSADDLGFGGGSDSDAAWGQGSVGLGDTR